MPETIASRPLPKRPENGLLAWQATIGYISSQYSLDAMLTLQAFPLTDGAVVWAAAASWGQNREQVQDMHSLPEALRDLWKEVDRSHVIFESREAVLKRPSNYSDNEWLDIDTATILERLLQVSYSVYGDSWQMVLVYQPVEKPDARFQARLLVPPRGVQTSGQGATLRDACRDLYRNAAQFFVAHSGKKLEDL
ncbi:MAG: hypothetical protein JNJ61_11380 [Anaerolineae bacterium]|nr:hypothetical protein [Anaerolineae bacterium]